MTGPGGSRVRRARPDEAAALTALARASKAVWGYPAAMLARFAAELTITPAAIRDLPVFVVAGDDDRPLAVGAIGEADGTAEIAFMFVAPGALRRGFGRLLFARLAAEARQRGYLRLAIQADPHAVGFYERMGAVRIGESESASIAGRMLPVLAYAL
ncbi:MAG: GNAT family N-acetyltransferase [Alphaproteobacteria bacterium]